MTERKVSRKNLDFRNIRMPPHERVSYQGSRINCQVIQKGYSFCEGRGDQDSNSVQMLDIQTYMQDVKKKTKHLYGQVGEITVQC